MQKKVYSKAEAQRKRKRQPERIFFELVKRSKCNWNKTCDNSHHHKAKRKMNNKRMDFTSQENPNAPKVALQQTVGFPN